MNTNQFLTMMEKRQADIIAADVLKEEKKATGDQEMADESNEVSAAPTTMINTKAAPSKGVLIGSNHTAIEDDVTEEDDRRGALAFIAEQEKKRIFRDRRTIQLEAVKRQAHHTRAKIRVKMPDGYILQGTFGAKEKVKDIFDFVKESILLKDRPFYLFETPPKRLLTNMK